MSAQSNDVRNWWVEETSYPVDYTLTGIYTKYSG